MNVMTKENGDSFEGSRREDLVVPEKHRKADWRIAGVGRILETEV